MRLSVGRAGYLPLARFILFFALFYLYVHFVIDPRIIYSGYSIIPTSVPAFYRGTAFLQRFLVYPGGIAEYIYCLLSQFYYFQFWGSFVITLAAMLICAATLRYLTVLRIIRFRVLCFIPALIIIIIYSQYIHCLDIWAGLLLALLLFLLYARFQSIGAISRIAIFVLLSGLLYYAAGGNVFLFSILCGIFEITFLRKSVQGLAYLVVIPCIVLLLNKFLLDITPVDGYLRVTPFHPANYAGNAAGASALYIFFPLMALWTPLHSFFAGIIRRFSVSGICARITAPLYSFVRRIIPFLHMDKHTFAFETLLLFIVLGLSAAIFLNPVRRTIFKINYLWCCESWQKLLAEEGNMPIENYPYFINHDINKALFYTGQLSSRMFCYPQNRDALLTLSFFDLKRGGARYGSSVTICADLPRLCDAFFHLGFINNAEHLAYETLESIGEHPAILRQLFFIHAVKFDMETARIYLNLLSKTLLFGDWAQSYLRKLDADPLLMKDPFVQHIRSIMVRVDLAGSFSAEEFLLSIINNAKNRMAFEYLMAYYLLSSRPEKIVENLYRLDDYGYSDLPRHYEEAVIIYINETGNRIDLHGRSLSRESVQRFMKFHEIFNRHRDNPKEAYDALNLDFGDSYFFYHVFSRSGVKR